MNSKFKFRGYDKVGEKGWVYGDLVHNMKTTKTGLAPRVMVGGYEVYENSVGPSLGLRDQNKREIFDGDILFVKFGDSVCAYVVVGWSEKTAAFGIMGKSAYQIHKSVKEKYADFDNKAFVFYKKKADVFKVVGNVFENEELMERERPTPNPSL